MPQGDVKEATTVGYAANSLDREDDSSAARCQGASMERHLEGTGQAELPELYAENYRFEHIIGDTHSGWLCIDL